jgi:hypothetical protein
MLAGKPPLRLPQNEKSPIFVRYPNQKLDYIHGKIMHGGVFHKAIIYRQLFVDGTLNIYLVSKEYEELIEAYDASKNPIKEIELYFT